VLIAAGAELVLCTLLLCVWRWRRVQACCSSGVVRIGHPRPDATDRWTWHVDRPTDSQLYRRPPELQQHWSVVRPGTAAALVSTPVQPSTATRLLAGVLQPAVCWSQPLRRQRTRFLAALRYSYVATACHLYHATRCLQSLALYGTKVRRYNWHSAGSLGWPFPVLKY